MAIETFPIGYNAASKEFEEVTNMQSITLQSHVGKDGILRLQVPPEFNDTDVQITLALEETHQNGVAKLLNQNQVQEKSVESQLTNEELEALAQANGWPPGFLEATYGCLKDDPIERPPQGEYEVREEFL